MKQLLKQVRKRNIRSTRNVYSICDSDHSSNVYPDNSSLFYPSSNDSLNSSSDSHSNYKYKPISKEECLQNESSVSSNSGYTIPPLGLCEYQPFDISSIVFIIGILVKLHSFPIDPVPWHGLWIGCYWWEYLSFDVPRVVWTKY